MMYSYPEAARERDLHKYYRPWLDAQSLEGADSGISIKGLAGDGYTPQSSRDRALTAFAQLAALRLDTRRCMVSLIDSNRQYILAEATRTVSLFTANAEKPEDEVWLGNAILNRADAVCYHTFSSTYSSKECDGTDYKTECMVIPDCQLDPRFADRDYVKDGSVRFYAGVPIITKAGHRIGVYAVSDDKPRDGLSAAEVRFMEDVGAAVMEHLELAKDSLDRIKGERMVRGLTQFIERSSVHDAVEAPSRATTMERQTDNARLQILEEDDAQTLPVATPALAIKPSHWKRGEASDTARVFQRAARIIRQSTDADGVIFFDTSAAGISAMLALHEMRSAPVSSDESATQNNTTDFETCDSTASRRQRRRKKVTFVEPSTEGESVESTPCPVAALSLRPGNATLVHADFAFTNTAMERYIHRYPLGKFFNYNDEGIGINSSDERSQTSETEQSDRTETERSPKLGPKKPRKKRGNFYPSEFLEVLPNVRTLIFLPLWDHSSERWVAGGFIWTTRAGHLMSPEHELPYLQAFGNSIISEVARLNAQKADKAKTTFIASISHELRSPLHGILGSVELLRETAGSAYQDSLVSSIDVSGRVLLDTIDHVLDYAKINKLRSTNARKKQQRGNSRARHMPADNSILGVTADFDLAQLVEEVCDTVCAGHTFRKTQNHNGGAIYDQAENKEDNNSDGDILKAGQATHGSVIVSLIVAPYVSWVVRSQPGALRRIVMNLIGNSLKYTDSGHITISLTQNKSASNTLDLALLVEDSGCGMSQEYQRTRLFSPFSQEDPFSSGTGLGLSIVKQIVESLHGDIEVNSTVAIGTQVRVTMRLPYGHLAEAKRDRALLDASESLRNTSVYILTEPDTQDGKRNLKTKESIHKACQNLNMNISTHVDADTSKQIPDIDFLVTDSSSLDQLLDKPSSDQVNCNPLSLVCVCTDVSEKTALENRVGRQIEALGWISEFVTQPCGPRKLARVMLSTLRRASKESHQRQSLFRSSTATAMSPDHLQPHPPLPHRSVSDSCANDSAANDPNGVDIVPLSSHTPSSIIHPSSSSSSSSSSSLTSSITAMTVPRVTPAADNQAQEYFTPTVLLVDDNAINLKLLVVFSRRQNLRYAEATNGLEALNKYKQDALANDEEKPLRPFDFVLMDLSMPVMGGLESTRQIRQFEKKMGLGRCCIVALTGLASAQDQQDAQDAGVDMYLVKPVKFADIKRVFGAR